MVASPFSTIVKCDFAASGALITGLASFFARQCFDIYASFDFLIFPYGPAQARQKINIHFVPPSYYEVYKHKLLLSLCDLVY